jgi:hypothetical protein
MGRPRHAAWPEDRLQITVMISGAMAKSSKQPPSAPIVARRRGRPPKSGVRIPQVEVQRAYRARLAAAGKVVRIVDAAAVDPVPPRATLASVPDFDPATQPICDRVTFVDMRDQLHNALLKLELREQDVQRLEQRNAYLEGELKLQAQHHTNSLKDLITLRQQLAETPAKRRPRRRST